MFIFLVCWHILPVIFEKIGQCNSLNDEISLKNIRLMNIKYCKITNVEIPLSHGHISNS